ncbi:uncharacterized protein LOC135151692 [Daucus carota subsp. sativus]|uniref:VWFA domain-containing protein n=1 Tax=Daucus carota subsp. sativus TaxID=79200 RepID=A0A166ASL7_DAUCS
MADEFTKAVQDGISLSKRLNLGKGRSAAPPKPMSQMDKSSHPQSYLPTAPMIYAVIPDPSVVDNPDIPSYQPHVHGRCDPPALIPLHMNAVSVQAHCYLDTAFVTVTASWRLHCVMRNRHCDCRFAIPLAHEGSVLSVEVDAAGKSYSTQLISTNEEVDTKKVAKPENGGFVKPHIFTFTIPQVDGGSNVSVKVRWSHKLQYQNGQFNLIVPFSFPSFVNPAGNKMSKKEKIHLDINSGPGTEVVCKTISHPLKELRRDGGKLGFFYESQVLSWSTSDFIFTYGVSTNSFANVILQSPSVFDIDKRDMFCLYMFPGSKFSKKVFKKEVLFVVDISGSMRGKPLEDTKSAIFAALSELIPGDSFNVIAFNDEAYLFSSSLELATKEAIEKATEWIGMNFVAGGGTNLSLPLNKAIDMFSSTQSTFPIIILITDGAVEDERDICDILESHMTKSRSLHPRIYTFGIGSFCNHYFLRMLAEIGRGRHEAAYEVDSIEMQMKNFFRKALSTVLANIRIGSMDNLDELEIYPSRVPDLLSESPLIIYGRYCGKFPNTTKIEGILSDMSKFTIDVKLQEAKEMPVDEILAKHQIESYTAQSWFSKSKDLEIKIAELSEQTSVISEYTRMILLEEGEKHAKTVSAETRKKGQLPNEVNRQKLLVFPNSGIGFGSVSATAANSRPGRDEHKLPESAEMFIKAASNCCSIMCGHCCCMCCIQTCSRINDQCAIILTQFCTALSCLGCYSCCEACCGSDSL